MSASPTDPKSALLEALRAYLLATDPAFAVEWLALKSRDGSKIKLRVSLPLASHPGHPVAAASAPSSSGPCKFSEMEQNVIEALGLEEMTGQQIADKAGYPYEKDLRVCLASLRRRGVLTGNKGDAGYSVANP